MSRILFAIPGLVLLTSPALGHSSLERSEPKDGETLKVAPGEIRMWFTEPIKVGLSTFEVRNQPENRSINATCTRMRNSRRWSVCRCRPIFRRAFIR